ncbi:glycosyltransferase family 4 protein [Bacteroides ovatus]|jgi:glycosyltransferase involved in cell wall biosynthesis|uniref:glycosyltransferase family 4 protein n=1 Tax=Bacteroides ovatus TaxID=28116 RepID=UPI00189C48BC|nr:glycosyltransferase family 4 protein [Bacteroides ovatus]MDC2648958.1 glycosyltransferase family 4 protein [Bacteroides ovatus]
MKVLLLPAYFHPETAASGYLSENRNEAFTEAGFDLVAYVPTPCRGITPEVRKEYCKKEHKHQTLYHGKMRVHRYSLYTEGKNPLLRALRYSFNWIIQLWYGLMEKNVDCIYLASTPPIQGMIGSFVKKFRGIPFVYNLQDIFPDSLFNNGLANKGGLLWKIGRVIENFTYKHADKIIVISEDFKKNIMTKGVPEEKIVVVYNWVDQNAVVDIPRYRNKLFDRYGLDKEKFYVSYNGNIGLSQNMDMLLQVAEEFQSSKVSEFQDIHFVLLGEGAYKAQVEKMVEEKKLTNVHLIPFQPYEDISYVFSLGDASLVISKPGTGAASVPSKTWSIMSASRPVLANFDENELKDIVEKHNCGIFTKAGDKEAFKESILTLYRNRELAKEMGRNGRQFVMDNLTREVGTHKYVDVIKSVVKEK